MVEESNQTNNQERDSPVIQPNQEEPDSGDDIMFVDSDDSWDPVANRGELTSWMAAIDQKINREGTARGFKQYAATKMEREQEELKEKTAEEQK